jgi:pimeloyl-ACP methyl ester carboxylesterase
MVPVITRYRGQKKMACQKLQSGSRLYKTAAGVIEAAMFGYGSTVLISHGSGGGYDMGIWLAQLIGGRFHHIAPSRFGYLRSPSPPDPTPQAQADAYAALMDALEVNSAVIIGLSAGGASALQFALRHSNRCRGVIMISAVSYSVPPLPLVLRAIYPLMLKSDFIPWLLYTTSPSTIFQANGVSRALLAQIKPDREKMHLLDALYQTTFPATMRREGMINDIKQLTNFPVYPIEHIKVPALIIHAINDPIIPFQMGEFSATKIPDARFLKLQDGGHFTCATHREVTIPNIQDFLNRYGI